MRHADGVDKARVQQLEEERRALAREAKRLMLAAVKSERQPTSAEHARLDALRAETEIIDAELERAFYAPEPDV
jgi:hypothetical protein